MWHARAILEGMTTTQTAIPNLYRVLSLRDDYPEGECWAWMDSTDRRCAKPADDSHLCTRHAKVAQAKLDRLAAKAAPKVNPERRAMLESRIRTYEAKLEGVTARLDALMNAGRPDHFDHGMLNLPLKGRMMTDSQLDRWRDLTDRKRRYEDVILGARADLRKLA